ncbi:hypothetical protein [Veillonella sp.]|nr:hypothetical protein [Veillonella sp.]
MRTWRGESYFDSRYTTGNAGFRNLNCFIRRITANNGNNAYLFYCFNNL